MSYTKQKTILASVLCAAALTLPATAQAGEDLAPVQSLDIGQYVGTWYQLAAIPQIFNLQCAKDTQAVYGIIDNDTISVNNTCTTFWNAESGVEGTATIKDSQTNAQLRVVFPSVPFGQEEDGDVNYIVTYIAPDYSWALVGGPKRTSGFVLSRSASVSNAKWAQIKQVIRDRGYWDCSFWTSPTSEGISSAFPLCFLPTY